MVLFEPRHEKTCLRGFRPGKTQTSLLSYRDKLEAWTFGYSKKRYYTIQAVNNKGADQTAQMHRLICAFVVRIWHEQVFSWRGSFVYSLALIIGSLSNFHTTERLDIDLDRQQTSTFYLGPNVGSEILPGVWCIHTQASSEEICGWAAFLETIYLPSWDINGANCCNTLLHNANKFYSILSETLKLRFEARTWRIICFSLWQNRSTSCPPWWNIRKSPFTYFCCVERNLHRNYLYKRDRNTVIWLVDISSMGYSMPNLIWFDFCFTALQHILSHFGHGQLP